MFCDIITKRMSCHLCRILWLRSGSWVLLAPNGVWLPAGGVPWEGILMFVHHSDPSGLSDHTRTMEHPLLSGNQEGRSSNPSGGHLKS